MRAPEAATRGPETSTGVHAGECNDNATRARVRDGDGEMRARVGGGDGVGRRRRGCRKEEEDGKKKGKGCDSHGRTVRSTRGRSTNRT